MTHSAASKSQHLITLVLRIWQAGPHPRSDGLRLQATHIQTGEVAYFETIEGVANHIERLAHTLSRPPIDLSEARRRSNNHGSS
jgi:hypothetical protein